MVERKKKTALASTMEQIHHDLAQSMLDRIAASKKVGGLALTSAEMSSIAKFLADNGVVAAEGDEEIGKLAEDLPFGTPSVDDEPTHTRH